MGAIYGGKLPHTPGYIAGGFTAVSSQADKDAFDAYLNDLITFIQTKHIPDAELLANLYSDYLLLGKGYGNLLAFGVFELDNAPSPQLLFRRGRLVNGNATVQTVDVAQITEQIKYSWYTGPEVNPAVGDTVPQYPKGDAYSWLKAPRYGGVPYEVGPLARMTVNGDYSNGISVMDRHLARARETLKVALAMRDWLTALPVDQGAFTPFTLPDSATSMGLTKRRAARWGTGSRWVPARSPSTRSSRPPAGTCRRKTVPAARPAGAGARRHAGRQCGQAHRSAARGPLL